LQLLTVAVVTIAVSAQFLYHLREAEVNNLQSDMYVCYTVVYIASFYPSLPR